MNGIGSVHDFLLSCRGEHNILEVAYINDVEHSPQLKRIICNMDTLLLILDNSEEKKYEIIMIYDYKTGSSIYRNKYSIPKYDMLNNGLEVN
jgi:hypothetical protein